MGETDAPEPEPQAPDEGNGGNGEEGSESGGDAAE